jgi:hypothetical protein
VRLEDYKCGEGRQIYGYMSKLSEIIYTKYILKVKIQSPENIVKHSFIHLKHLYLLFNIVTMDRNALSEPGKELFLFQRRVNIPAALLAMENGS